MMLPKVSLSLAAASAALLMALAPVSAAPSSPLSLLKGSVAQQSMVEQAHGWHRTCRKGFTDVHKHVKGVGRVTCHSRRCHTNSLGIEKCTWS